MNNKLLIEMLNDTSGKPKELTHDMMEGVRVYEIDSPAIDYDNWLNREHLNLDELLLLSLKENPDDKDLSFFDSIGLNDDETYQSRHDDAERWINAREFQARKVLNEGSKECKEIDPFSFFSMAKLKGWYLPEPVLEWLENRQRFEVVPWCGEIHPLEPLTDEEKQHYNKLAAWSWVDAIYILQGYKPVFQLSTEQVRSHFPDWVAFFTQSIQLGSIGKETNQAGERTFIDSPERWQAFWQGINKPMPETQAETVGDAGAGCLDERQDFQGHVMVEQKTSSCNPKEPPRPAQYDPRTEPPPPADFETWKKADLWTVGRGLMLLLRVEDIFDFSGHWEVSEQFKKLKVLAETSIRAGKLKTLPSPLGQVIHSDIGVDVLPVDFLAWAQLKGIPMPEELEGLRDTCADIQADSKSINDERNKVAKKWLNDERPSIGDMTSWQILDALLLYSNSNTRLFGPAAKEWLARDHSVIPKRKAGRKSSW